MPTIEFNKNDLLDLVGEQMDDMTLEEQLTRIKVEVESIENDKVEVEVTSDRIDLLSVEGIARNLRAHRDITPGIPTYTLNDDNYRVTVEDVEIRPEIVTAVVKDVKLSTAALKSLIQLQEKLHGTFGRDRKRISIGIHDMNDISFPLTYKSSKPDEYSFVPLEHSELMTLEQIANKHKKGKEYADIVSDAEQWPIIVDSDETVLSFPPVINADITEVTDSSTDLFIDVTGTDKDAISHALAVIVTALKERGGTIHAVNMVKDDKKYITPDFSTQKREIPVDYLEDVIGVTFTADDAVKYLEKMMYGAESNGNTITVSIPSFRADILHDIDLAEDIAIGYGYNMINPSLPNLSTIGSQDPLESFMHSIRDIMIGHRYQEVMNPSLTDEKTLMTAGREGDVAPVEIANPVSKKYTHARDRLLPQLLVTLGRNTHNSYPQKVFEAADVVIRDNEADVKTRTDKHLAAVTAQNKITYNTIRGELEGALEALEADYSFEKTASSLFINGRTAEVIADGNTIGVVGEVHPKTLDHFGIDTPVAGFELDLSELYSCIND